jgi:hypothetical protein
MLDYYTVWSDGIVSHYFSYSFKKNVNLCELQRVA